MSVANGITVAQTTSAQRSFFLTFAQPLRLNPAQSAHQLFGHISDGLRAFEILQWPTKLPSSFQQNSIVSLRVFSAQDASAFQRGIADSLAVCHVPLVKIAELVASSTQPATVQIALEATTSGDGEIDLQNRGLVIERFERNRQALSQYPLQPKICVIVEQTQGTDAPTVSRFSSAPSSLLAQDVSTSDRAPLRFYSVTSGAPAQVEESSIFAAKIASTTGGSGKALQSPAAMTPDLVRTLSPMVTPFSPQEFVSPRSNEAEKNWLVTWETRWAEENARITKSAREYEKAFRAEQAREKRKLIVFEQGVSILEDQRARWQVHEHFRTWQRWLANEKASCQFQQLAGEHEQLKQVHEIEERSTSERLASETSVLEQKIAAFSARRSREAVKSNVLQTMWAALLQSGLVAASLLVWHRLSVRSKTIRHNIEETSQILVIELLFLVVRSWFNYRISLKRAAALDVSSNTCRGLPQQLQQKTKVRVYRVLDWALRSREKLELDDWCSYVLWAWHQVSGVGTQYCNVVENMLCMRHSDIFEEALLRRAWSAWICERDACRIAASISSDIEQNARKILSARDHSIWVMDLSNRSREHTDMLSTILCWRYVLSMHRMQCALEQISIEQQIVHDETAILTTKLESSRSEVLRSQAKWNEERAAMRKSLSIVQSELVESRDFTAQMLSECSRLSHLHQACSDQHRSCAGELASARADRIYASEQLKGRLESYMTIRQQAEQQAMECESMERDLLMKQEQLQEEASKHADKRMLDIREMKSQSKGEISKHEQAAEDLRESRSADQQLWASRFKQTESRRTQLEKEMQAVQRSVTMATPRSAGYEVERQQLQRRLAIAESRLARSETTSSCEAELNTLRGEFEQANARYAELSEKVQQEELRAAQTAQNAREIQERTREVAVAHNADSSITSSPVPMQRGHERGPLSPPRANNSSGLPGSPLPSPGSVSPERDQNLRAMLDDFQRAVRAPRSPLSSVGLGHESPENGTRKSSPSFSISDPLLPRDRRYSEDSLPSESIIQGNLSPMQNTSTDTGNSVAQNLAQRLDEAPWMASSASGGTEESPLGSAIVGGQQSRLQWLLTPPRSPESVRVARTPPRRRSSSPMLEVLEDVPERQQVSNDSVDVEVADDSRPRPRGITAARANALWRQQTLTEGDAERRTLQQRVEQMRRQINAERAAAPRRHTGGMPLPMQQVQMQAVGR